MALARAIAAAPPARCPYSALLYAVSESTGRAYPMPCDSWACPHCGSLRKLAAAASLAQGIAIAHSEGKTVRLVTLTAPAAGITLPELSKAWKRLMKRLGRFGWQWESYARVYEWQERGEPHYHAVFVGPPMGAAKEADPGYLPQAELSRMAAASGFGPVCDIRLVQPPKGKAVAVTVAEYLDPGKLGKHREAVELAARLPRYLTKQQAEQARELTVEKGGKLIAPYSVSKRWPAGTYGSTRATLRAVWSAKNESVDAGPWKVVTDTGDVYRASQEFRRDAARAAKAATTTVPPSVPLAERRTANAKPRRPAQRPAGRGAGGRGTSEASRGPEGGKRGGSLAVSWRRGPASRDPD